MKFKSLISALLIFLVCFIAGGSGAEEPQKKVMSFLAVMDLNCGTALNRESCTALTNIVIDEIVKIGKYKVVDRANRDKILSEAGFQQTGCVDESCTIEMGRVMGVGRMVVGSITKLGTTYLLNLQLLNVETATVEITATEECECELKGLINAIRNVSRKLMGETPAPTPQPETPPTPAAPSYYMPPSPTAPQPVGPVGKGNIAIATNPPGADIFLDAMPMGKTPKKLTDIIAGTHQLTLMLAGYSTLNKGVEVKTGQTVTVSEILLQQTGTLDITSTPQGANVWLDNRFVGKTPIKIPSAKVGKHSVKITMTDYSDYTAEANVEANETATVNAKMSGLPGRVLITSTPSGAEVYVDSRKVGITPYSGELAAGNHTIRVGMNGYQSEKKTITIIPNKAQTLDVVLKKGPDVRGDMIFVPAGEFMMGCNAAEDSAFLLCTTDDRPYHKVYLDSFYIDKFEVTVEQYKTCVTAGSCSQPAKSMYGHRNWGVSGRENHPINCVDWDQSKTYCEYAGKRLPTEAQWEKAARGTDGRKYPWGNEAASCNYAVMNEYGDGCGRNSTWQVGSKPAGASPYGAMDMAGNVWEWTADWYGENYYSVGAYGNPMGPSSGQYRVLRGGALSYFPPIDDYLRSSLRLRADPTGWDGDYGFRCVR